MRFKFTTTKKLSVDILAAAKFIEQYTEKYGLEIDSLNIYVNFKKGDFKYELYGDENDEIFEINTIQIKDIDPSAKYTVSKNIVALRPNEFIARQEEREFEKKQKEKEEREKRRMKENTGFFIIHKREDETYKFHFIKDDPSGKKKDNYLQLLNEQNLELLNCIQLIDKIQETTDKIKLYFSKKRQGNKNAYMLNNDDLKLLNEIIIQLESIN